MQIQAGTRLGPYEIVAPIGAGVITNWRSLLARREKQAPRPSLTHVRGRGTIPP